MSPVSQPEPCVFIVEGEMTKKVEQLADEHVAWLMKILNEVMPPLLKEEFIHGYKHGLEVVDTKLEGERK